MRETEKTMWRLPSKDKKIDYDYFMTLMTEKLKRDLTVEIKKKQARDKHQLLRESFNEKKELLKEALFGPIEA